MFTSKKIFTCIHYITLKRKFQYLIQKILKKIKFFYVDRAFYIRLSNNYTLEGNSLADNLNIFELSAHKNERCVARILG